MKKQKAQKGVSWYKNLNTWIIKKCLEANQHENEMDFLKNDIETDSLRENHRELIKNNRILLRSQQRFRSKNHNIFTEEVNKIALSVVDDERIQPINSIGTYACGTSKGI